MPSNVHVEPGMIMIINCKSQTFQLKCGEFPINPALIELWKHKLTLVTKEIITFLALFLTSKSSVFINYKDKTQIHWFQDSWVAQLRRLRPNLFPSSIWKDFDLCRFRSLINTRKARAASFAAAFLAAERLSWLKVLEKIQERKHFSEWSRVFSLSSSVASPVSSFVICRNMADHHP